MSRVAGGVGVPVETVPNFVGYPLFDGSHQVLAADDQQAIIESGSGRAADVGVIIAVAIFAIEIIGWLVRRT